jgi:hypothetical protein
MRACRCPYAFQLSPTIAVFSVPVGGANKFRHRHTGNRAAAPDRDGFRVVLSNVLPPIRSAQEAAMHGGIRVAAALVVDGRHDTSFCL